MIRGSLPILGCIVLASTFIARTQADDTSALRMSDGDRLVSTLTSPDVVKWDVVVFKSPSDSNHNYIKRLIGLPGETLVIEHGQLRPEADVIDTVIPATRHVAV